MRGTIALAALLGLLSLGSIARADVELQNDGFTSGGQAVFQSGFAPGEAGASRFVAPASTQQLLKVHFLFGGTDPSTRTITLQVWDDTAGTDAPGTQLYSADFQVTGSQTAMQEIDVTADNIMVPMQFRVGLQFMDNMVQTIARDADGINASKNFILSGTWFKSNSLGLTGDWILRAVVTTAAGGGPDAGVGGGGDAGVTGGACQGNSSCPTGQYCDLAHSTCTFDCRMSSDCSSGATCNSLGQCVGGKGGGCATDGGGAGPGVAGMLFGLGMIVLMARRRRPSPRGRRRGREP
jgi:MYXO-CTERM domain-containing protein